MGAAPTIQGGSELPIETLGGQIKAHIAAGDKSVEKAEQHYKAAGLHLLEAKERVKRTAGITWPAFLRQHCSIRRSRADELIAIADGRTTLAEVREKSAASSARHRAAARSPSRDGKLSEIPKARQPAKRVDRRLERFEQALFVVTRDCDLFADIVDIPHLTPEEATAAVESLKQAEEHLKGVRLQLERMTGGTEQDAA